MSSSTQLYLCIPIVSAVVWASTYFLIQNYFRKQPDYVSRVVAGTHGLLITVLCLFAQWLSPNPLYSPGGPSTSLQELVIGFSLGYFLYDLGYALMFEPEDKIILLHHFLTIGCLSSSFLPRTSGTEMCTGIANFEITNPLLQSQWFMTYYGLENTIHYKMIVITFGVVFVVCRFGLGTPFVIHVLQHPKPDLLVKLFVLLMYVLSWVMIAVKIQPMVQPFIQRYRNTNSSRRETQYSTPMSARQSTGKMHVS